MASEKKTTIIIPPDAWNGEKSKPILCIEPLSVSTVDAARLLGVSRPTLYTLLNRSDFPSFRVGGRILISVDGLRDWIRQQIKGMGE